MKTKRKLKHEVETLLELISIECSEIIETSDPKQSAEELILTILNRLTKKPTKQITQGHGIIMSDQVQFSIGDDQFIPLRIEETNDDDQ